VIRLEKPKGPIQPRRAP